MGKNEIWSGRRDLNSGPPAPKAEEKNAICLARLALCCVISHDFDSSLSAFGPKLDPSSAPLDPKTLVRVLQRHFSGVSRCHCHRTVTHRLM